MEERERGGSRKGGGKGGRVRRKVSYTHSHQEGREGEDRVKGLVLGTHTRTGGGREQ